MRKWINPTHQRGVDSPRPPSSRDAGGGARGVSSSIRSEQYYEDCACAGFHFAFCTADGACDAVCGPSSRRALPAPTANKLDFLFQAETCRSPRAANKVNFAATTTSSPSSSSTKKKAAATTRTTTKPPAKKKK